jgi:hypothetical protein
MASAARQAARCGALDTAGMIRSMFGFAAVLAVAAIVRPAVAQEPQQPPVTPHTLRLVEQAPGEYTLIASGVAAALGPYEIAALVIPIGSDNGVVIPIAQSDEDQFAVALPLPLVGLRDEGCYHVGFFVRPQGQTKPGLEDAGARLDTRACIDAAGVVTFPAFDGVTSPPPAPPSDVRLVRNGDGWSIEWRDNSEDEVSFDPGMILMDKPWAEGGSAIASLDLPEVQRNDTGIGSIGFLFAPDGPTPPVCGYALVLVFAIGPDSPSIWPGNTTVPACFGYGTISFPDAGVGGGADGSLGHRAVLMLVGACCIAAGVALRVLHRRPDSHMRWFQGDHLMR